MFTLFQIRRPTNVAGKHGGAIKIKLRAPAVEGKANAALRSFLAKELGIPERTISIERGHKSREKLIRIDELGDADVRSRLMQSASKQIST